MYLVSQVAHRLVGKKWARVVVVVVTLAKHNKWKKGGGRVFLQTHLECRVWTTQLLTILSIAGFKSIWQLALTGREQTLLLSLSNHVRVTEPIHFIMDQQVPNSSWCSGLFIQIYDGFPVSYFLKIDGHFSPLKWAFAEPTTRTIKVLLGRERGATKENKSKPKNYGKYLVEKTIPYYMYLGNYFPFPV